MPATTSQKKSKLKFVLSVIGGAIAFLSTIIGLLAFLTGKSDLPSLLSLTDVVMYDWDKDKASKVVLSILQKEFPYHPDLGAPGWYSEHATPDHIILDHYYLKYDKNDERFITIAYSKVDGLDFYCRKCGPIFSFFEFKKLDEDGWIIGKKHLAALTAGSHGVETPLSVKVNILGNDTWGVFIRDSDYNTNLEVFEVDTSIYVDLAGKYQQVFFEATELDNSNEGQRRGPGYYSVKSDISTRPAQGTSFFDLIVTTTGVRDNQQISEEKVFKFDGQRYSTGLESN